MRICTILVCCLGLFGARAAVAAGSDAGALLLDNGRYQAELAAAQDEPQRRAVLHRRWEAVKRVLCRDILLQDRTEFFSTLQYWQSGYPREAVIVKESLHLTRPPPRLPPV